MKKMLIISLMVAASVNAFAGKAKSGVFYSDVTKMELDPKLPEPFSRTRIAQVLVDFNDPSATLLFEINEDEGIEVTFPIVSDLVDKCNNRTIVAAPPAGSTPYYKDFEIKVTDYSENTCATEKPVAPTTATLKSYEVRHKSNTFSTFEAGKLIPAPKN